MAVRSRKERAFTLLEAIVAIVILTSVAIVCLQLRAQSAAQAVRLREHQAAERALDTLLAMAEAELLPDPEGPEEDDPAQRIEWRGEHLGRSYVCTRRREPVRNPVATPDDEGVPQVILVDRYVVEFDGREAEMIRPVRVAREEREVIRPGESES